MIWQQNYVCYLHMFYCYSWSLGRCMTLNSLKASLNEHISLPLPELQTHTHSVKCRPCSVTHKAVSCSSSASVLILHQSSAQTSCLVNWHVSIVLCVGCDGLLDLPPAVHWLQVDEYDPWLVNTLTVFCLVISCMKTNKIVIESSYVCANKWTIRLILIYSELEVLLDICSVCVK